MDPQQRWGTVIGLLLVLIAATQATCPGSPWQEWRGHCYRLTYREVPWHGVRGDCKAFFRSADAASVTSKAENDFIQTLTERGNVWLGMRSANNILTWVDGTSVTFRNLPGGRTRTKGAEDVVEMVGRTGRWRFAESHAAGPRRGVCKMASCQCPAGWTEWGRRCYKAVRQPLSWLGARDRCRRMADTGDLVSIINQRENNFVFGLLQQRPFWIGLNDREQEGKYIWSSGETYPYTNWHRPSEPNGRNHSADCTDMLPDKTWSDSPCGATGPFKPFVCEQIICGRDKQIRNEPVRGRRYRVWRPEDGLRCPEGWSRSGDGCYSPPTAADTFSGVQRLCSDVHPAASVALIDSLEENDRAFYAADSLPLWVDYGSRSGRAANLSPDPRIANVPSGVSTFTYWAADVALARSVDSDCAALEESSQWRPRRCEQERLPALCRLPACDPECPRGWIPHEGRCYRTVRVRRTLTEAAAVCQRDGGHLASVQTQDENDFLTTLAFRTKGVDYRADWDERHVWIGASRADRLSAWSWSDCSDWTLSRWTAGDGDDPSLTTGTCATLYYSGRWRDNANCTEAKYNSICELDPCREHFGLADKTGCRVAKVTEPQTGPARVPDTPETPDTPEVPETVTASPEKPKEKFVCPPDWTEFDGSCYHGVVEPATLVNALQTCAGTFRPANVASAHTVEQNRLLLELTGGGPTWLGLTSVYDFPRWRWLDGSNSDDFSAWGDRQPDTTAENKKACSVVNRRGRWAARSCLKGRNSYVCKLPAVRVTEQSSCPTSNQWREEGGTCYIFNHREAAFSDARRDCLKFSSAGFRATLPVVDDAEEDAALLRMVNGHVMRLGLVRSQSGKWLWDDGSTPVYTNWLHAPPPLDGKPLCAVIDGRRGGWTTQDCNNMVPFYCEAEPVPDDYDDDYDYYDYEQ